MRWSIIVSVVWIFSWLGVGLLSDPPIWNLQLNEAGDFWAGMAAPLAFYWLVLGFFQQGRELNLQVQEMRLSVEQFERQSSIMQQQLEFLFAEKSEESLLRQLESIRLDLIDALKGVVRDDNLQIGNILTSGNFIRLEELVDADFVTVARTIYKQFSALQRSGRLSNSSLPPQLIVEAANKLDQAIRILMAVQLQAEQLNCERVLLEFRNADFDKMVDTLTFHFELASPQS